MLSQVREFTGIASSALQNWIKRGWVSNPVSKRYSIDQVARILIINMLRDVLQLEKISFLLGYVNGRMDDESDNIIAESKLYDYFCKIIEVYSNSPTLDIDHNKLEKIVKDQTSDYKEPVPGAGKRLRKALWVMVLAYVSAQIRSDAQERLAAMEEEIF